MWFSRQVAVMVLSNTDGTLFQTFHLTSWGKSSTWLWYQFPIELYVIFVSVVTSVKCPQLMCFQLFVTLLCVASVHKFRRSMVFDMIFRLHSLKAIFNHWSEKIQIFLTVQKIAHFTERGTDQENVENYYYSHIQVMN